MPQRVLVVDDEEHILTVTAFRLEKQGYEVLTASDGMVALAMIQEQKPDLVLLDLRLPGMNGAEVCKRVKEDEALKHIPIILFSASESYRIAEMRSEVSADDFIVKPFSRDELLGKVQKLLAG